MAGVGKTLRLLFFAGCIGVVAFILIQAAVSGWRNRDVENKILASCRLAVLGEDPGFPPALRIELVNGSGRDLSPTHIRLVFYLADRQVSRLDENHPLQAGETLKLLLQSIASGDGAPPPPTGSRIRYSLLVFPLSKRPLPEIRGDMILENR
jgi:hypothetical protein